MDLGFRTYVEPDAPVADAGADAETIIGRSTNLDGSGSSDPDDDPLSYTWTVLESPTGSLAALSDAGSATPSFAPDLSGAYVFSLVVSDGIDASTPDTVTITAVSVETYVAERITVVAGITAGLSGDRVTNSGNRTALGQFLQQALDAVAAGDLATAREMLQQSLIRTDGCALRGRPDPNGPARDWIVDCSAQASVYGILVAALDALAG